MIAPQLLDSEPLALPGSVASKGVTSWNSRRRRGRSRGGASRAAMKAAHCSASSSKRCRSASVSSARAKALSSTNWLTERWVACAAVCSVRFASRESRRSSLAVRAGMGSSIGDQHNTAARHCHDIGLFARLAMVPRGSSSCQQPSVRPAGGVVACSGRLLSRRLRPAAARRGGQGRRSRDRSHAQPRAASMARTHPLTVPSTVALRGMALGSCLRLGSWSGRAGAIAPVPSLSMPGEPFLLELHGSRCCDLLQGCLRGWVEGYHPLRRHLKRGFTVSLAAAGEP